MGKTKDAMIKYRLQADKNLNDYRDAMKKITALQTIIKAHNITVDFDKLDVSELKFENGEVKGEFKYDPKQPGTPPATPPKDTKELTYEDVKKMSSKEINKNWDKVAPILEAHGE